MTAPINPTIVQQPGVGQQAQQAFQPFVEALALNRKFKQQQQEFQLKMEEFQLQKFATQKQGELTDQQIAESKARQARQEQEMELAQRAIAGQQAGNNAMNLAAMRAQSEGIEFGTPEWSALIRDARASLHDLDAKAADVGAAHGVLDAYEDQLRESTVGSAQIEADKARQALAQEQARSARRESQLAGQKAVLELGQDVPLPLGIIGEQIGASVTPELQGVVLPSALGGAGDGKENDQVLRARVFNTIMQPEAARIKGLLAQGTRIQFVGSLNALISGQAGFLGTAARILSNKFIPEDQRQYIASTRNYVAAWQYFSSGAQINEGEYFRLYQAVIPTRDDDDRTIAVKMSIIDTQLEAIKQIANGRFAGGPADGAIAALESLEARGQAERWSPQIRSSISRQLDHARTWRSEVARNPNAMLLAPPDLVDADGNLSPFNPNAAEDRINAWGSMFDNAFTSPSQLELPR